MITFSPSQTGDPILERIQVGLKNAINPIIAKPVVDGILTNTLALTTSFQNLPHRLGREPLGWLLVSPDASATVWQDAIANNPDPAKFLRVRASAAVNVKFWVF